MKSIARIAACLIPVVAASAAFAQTLVLEPHAIRDPMANNKVALTFLKPKGWTVSGGVKWYPEAMHQACIEMKITNPNGTEQIETLPWCHCAWFTNPVIPMQRGTNYMGSLVELPMTPKEVVQNMTIPSVRRGARITDVQDLPDVAKQLSKVSGGLKIISQRIRIEYTLSGQAMEEDIYLSLYYVSADLGVNNCVSHMWGAAWTPFSMRAAKGKLDAQNHLLLPMVSSSKYNAAWLQEYYEVCNLFRKRMNQSIINARAISDTITRNSNEIFNMISSSYWNRQASQDRIHNNFSDYMRGVTRYNSPHESYPVQLPGGYQYAWAGSDGTYVLSNDAGFNPNVGSTVNWTLMDQSR